MNADSERLKQIEALQARHEMHLEASGHYRNFGYQLTYDAEWRKIRLELADSVPFLLAQLREARAAQNANSSGTLDTEGIAKRLVATTGGGDWQHCTGAYGAKYCRCGMVWSTSVDAVVHIPSQPDVLADNLPSKEMQAADSVFIAHAPADIAALLARVAELERQRDAAVAVIREVSGLSVLSSTVRFMEHAQNITGRYLYPEIYRDDAPDADARTGSGSE